MAITLPSPQDEAHSLSDQINVSTRAAHTRLNRLIIARLPLALPPVCTGPSEYVLGLTHIIPIYRTFETLWESILELDPRPSFPQAKMHESKQSIKQAPKSCSRIKEILEQLYLSELLRSNRLQDDIAILGDLEDEEVEVRILEASRTGHIAEFIVHITESVGENPHILIAYAWVLYMALFAGGRYLRASLQLGSEVWLRSRFDGTGEVGVSLRSHPSGLEFFNFPGHDDGITLKLEFKRRFAEAELALTTDERDDIIKEAQNIFVFMIMVVDELDQAVQKSKITSKDHLDDDKPIMARKCEPLTEQSCGESKSGLEDFAGPVVVPITSNGASRKRSPGRRLNRLKPLIKNQLVSKDTEKRFLFGFPVLAMLIGILLAMLLWHLSSLRERKLVETYP